MIKYGFVTMFTQDISQDMPEEMKQADCIQYPVQAGGPSSV